MNRPGPKPGGPQRGGGSRKGVPNKRTATLYERLFSDLKYDPVKELVASAQRTKDEGLRIKIALGLMDYIYPRRKAVELTGDRGPVKVNIVWSDPPSKR